MALFGCSTPEKACCYLVEKTFPTLGFGAEKAAFGSCLASTTVCGITGRCPEPPGAWQMAEASWIASCGVSVELGGGH